MDVKIQSIHFETTEKLDAFINKKVEKLSKTYEDIQKVEVQLKVEKPAVSMNKTTSFTVLIPGNKLFAEKVLIDIHQLFLNEVIEQPRKWQNIGAFHLKFDKWDKLIHSRPCKRIWWIDLD